MKIYAANAEAQYQSFLDKVGFALQKVTSAESIVLLGDFNAHVGTDEKTWKAVIERQGDSDINKNGRCYSTALCHQTIVHNKHLILEQGNLQVHLV